MAHVVLLGDSIFDNAAYVSGAPAVIDQVRGGLPPGWSATLLARDGDVVHDVEEQVRKLPAQATHFVISVGGNDALAASGLLHAPVRSVGDGLAQLAAVIDRFRAGYHGMLVDVRSYGKPVTVCTIYDAVPGLHRAAQLGVAVFNDVILREAVLAGVPVLDLRLICPEPGDYSALSPIEPSEQGGAKIAAAILRVVTGHDFAARRTVLYG
jgi:hypothetical protein